jgi:DNA-binding XRE family transcriptional regulator
MRQPKMTAGELRAVRKMLNMTQGELAARLGISRISVNHWEKDKLVKGIPDWVVDRLEQLGTAREQNLWDDDDEDT